VHVTRQQQVGPTQREGAHGRHRLADQAVMLRARRQVEGMMGDDDLDQVIAHTGQLAPRVLDLRSFTRPSWMVRERAVLMPTTAISSSTYSGCRSADMWRLYCAAAAVAAPQR
jgi:hypothetical protein